MRSAVFILLFSSILAPAQQPEAERLFGSAIEAQQRGDYPAAIEDYQKLLKLQPKMVEARANLGAALAHAGRLDEAIAQYRLALPDVPDKSAVHMNIGLAYYKKNDLANASLEFEEVRKQRPTDPQLAILLGDSYVRLGKSKDALAMLTPLDADNAANPDFDYVMGAALIQSGNRREGVTRLQKVAETTQSPDAYMLAGSTWLDLNEVQRAHDDLEIALKMNPKFPRIDTMVGMARDKTGDAAGAETAFRQALTVDPNDFDANLYLGAILYKRRDVYQAKPFLDKALQINPTSPLARYEMAMWKSTSGQYEDAAKDLESVVKEDPNWLEPHVELATVYYRLHRPEDGAKERAIVDRITAQQQSKGPGQQ